MLAEFIEARLPGEVLIVRQASKPPAIKGLDLRIDEGPVVIPTYLVIYAPAGALRGSVAEAFNSGLGGLLESLEDEIAAKYLRVSIIDLVNQDQPIVTLTDPGSLDYVPYLRTGEAGQTEADLQSLFQRIRLDIDQLTADGFQVPQVIVLIALDGVPPDPLHPVRDARSSVSSQHRMEVVTLQLEPRKTLPRVPEVRRGLVLKPSSETSSKAALHAFLKASGAAIVDASYELLEAVSLARDARGQIGVRSQSPRTRQRRPLPPATHEGTRTRTSKPNGAPVHKHDSLGSKRSQTATRGRARRRTPQLSNATVRKAGRRQDPLRRSFPTWIWWLLPPAVVVFAALVALRLEGPSDPQTALGETPTPEEAVSPEESSRPRLVLLNQIPDSLRGSCTPGGGYLVKGELISLECVGVERDQVHVFYSLYASRRSERRAFNRWLSDVGPILSRGCKRGEPGRGTWYYTDAPNKSQGRFFCYLNRSLNPWLVWEKNSSHIVAAAFSSRLRVSGLMDRWVTLGPKNS